MSKNIFSRPIYAESQHALNLKAIFAVQRTRGAWQAVLRMLLRQHRATSCHSLPQSRNGTGQQGQDGAGGSVSALPTCLPRGPGGAAWAELGATSLGTGPQRDGQGKPSLFVKRLALKIKNNKARETENANLTGASEERCSTEPEARNSPSFLLYRVEVFFLCQLVARKFSELRSAVLIVIAFEFN